MATAITPTRVRVYIGVAGSAPNEIASVDVPLHVDVLPSPWSEDGTEVVATLGDGWGRELGSALITIGQGLMGEGASQSLEPDA